MQNAAVDFDPPQPVFKGSIRTVRMAFGLAANTDRLLVNLNTESAAAAPLTLMVNWLAGRNAAAR